MLSRINVKEKLNLNLALNRFICPEREADAAGCQYRGQLYKVGESITGQLLPKRCYEECICEHWEDEK